MILLLVVAEGVDIKVQIKNILELRNWIKDNLIKQFQSKQVLLLEGPMGVGKTELVKNLVDLMGGTKEVCSPTFALHNTYHLSEFEIDHIDLFRLESESDLESMGFWDLFEKERGLIIIEWSDLMDSSFFPMSWSRLLVTLETDKKLTDIRYISTRSVK